MIERGSSFSELGLVPIVRVEHIVIDHALGPVIGRAAELSVHDWLVPLDPARRVLVLVDHANRVPELMEDNSLILPAQVHRRLIERDVRAIRADV